MPAARGEVAGTLECTRAATGSLGRIACMVTGGKTGSVVDSVILVSKFSHLDLSVDVENRSISPEYEMGRKVQHRRLHGRIPY